MKQITENIQDKGEIRPCKISLNKINTRCHVEILVCSSFQQKIFLKKLIDICLLYSAEDDINEGKVESSEIQEPVLPTKNMLAVNKIDADVNDGILYKNYIEIIQKELGFLKIGINEEKQNCL